MKKILIAITIFVSSIAGLNVSAYATNPLSTFGKAIGEDNAIIFKNCAKYDGEESIKCILKFVVDTLSIGVGILGVIGISVVGIQYLTAGGSEEKTRKAKRRMFEIIIGLLAYAVIYAALRFALPNYPNDQDTAIFRANEFTTEING